MKTIVLIAGATGNLGGRIVHALLSKGVDVHALVRTTSDRDKIEQLQHAGAKIVEADMASPSSLIQACMGASCVISALQGLRDVIVDTQASLLHAAVAAGVPRFIPSDFSSDFTKLPVGQNRNFDLRREFHEHLDKAPIAATSIFNGAFADILTYNTPILDLKKRSVGYWGNDADYKLDFTTMDNTAAFTAAAALHYNAPRKLHIASFQVSPVELVAIAKQVTNTEFKLTLMGTVEELAAYNQKMRLANPEGEQELYPRWQSSQYIQSMFCTQPEKLDNEYYEGIKWTSAHDFLNAQLNHH
jgi:NAD(P)-dependent dehydrogenase (short-subunit alcohol dehydrogenase family)